MWHGKKAHLHEHGGHFSYFSQVIQFGFSVKLVGDRGRDELPQQVQRAIV
jgi:hypothetical protein